MVLAGAHTWQVVRARMVTSLRVDAAVTVGFLLGEHCLVRLALRAGVVVGKQQMFVFCAKRGHGLGMYA